MVKNFQPSEEKKPTNSFMMWGQMPKLPTEWACSLYPRVSTLIQTTNVSAELQLKEDGELWNLALRLGWNEEQVRHPQDDMALSGRLKMEDRPAFKQMLNWIINGEIRAVIAVNVDRLFRDKWGTEYSKFMEICEKYHVIVVTPEMVYDFSDAYCVKSFRDKCIQAWEYLEYQVYKRMLGAKDYLGETGRWAGGNLPPGYIVDRNKKSPTFRRYIRYMPWSPIILRMFERYRELDDSLMALHREYDALPFMFPDFEEWVDPEIVAKVKLKKVPGGYTMGLTTMARMLWNPVYIGWWIYDNTILVGEDGLPKINHEPIIPPERQEELFWHAFRQRSPYNIDGSKNENGIGQRPRRYTQLNSPPCPALLKKIVKSGDPEYTIRVQPQYNAKNFRTGKYLYAFRKRMNGYSSGAKYMLSTDMVDDIFWNRLMEHLWEAEDFEAFAQTEEQEMVSVETEKKEIAEQIAACERKVSKLLKRLKAVEDEDEEETEEEQKKQDEVTKRFIKELKDDCKKFLDEKTRLEERLMKLDTPDDGSFAEAMITYHELLRQVGTRAREIYTIEQLYDMVGTFTTDVILDTVSPRVWKITIMWRDPAWGGDEIACLRMDGNPSITWTQEERQLLRDNYSIASRRQLIEMLPNRSWVGIRTIASEMKLRRHRDDSENEFAYDLCSNDWKAMQEYGLSVSVDENNYVSCVSREADSTSGAKNVGVKLVRSWK